MAFQISAGQKTRHPNYLPLPIAPSFAESADATLQSITSVPPLTSNRTPRPRPIPTTLAQKRNALDILARQQESLAKGIAYGLFTTALDYQNACARLLKLRNLYNQFRPQVEAELAAESYRSETYNTNVPTSYGLQQAPRVNTTHQGQPSSHKHRYGPTSPHYTVDKALKRKAENQQPLSATGAQHPSKRHRDSSSSDFVEEDCESDGKEGEKKKPTVEPKWPPEPIENLWQTPLPRVDKEKMVRWSWWGAMERAKMKLVEVEAMMSPMGSIVPW